MEALELSAAINVKNAHVMGKIMLNMSGISGDHNLVCIGRIWLLKVMPQSKPYLSCTVWVNGSSTVPCAVCILLGICTTWNDTFKR